MVFVLRILLVPRIVLVLRIVVLLRIVFVLRIEAIIGLIFGVVTYAVNFSYTENWM